MNKNNQPTSREEWFKLVEAQESSKLSAAEFCKQHDLILCRFVYYRKIYLKRQNQIRDQVHVFNPVVIKDEQHAHENVIKISFPNGVSLNLPSEYSPEQLKKIFGALMSC